MANSNSKTTLSVDKDFAEMLRQRFEGRNDQERLENWAESEQETQESYNNPISYDDMENLLTSKLEKLDIREGRIILK